MLSCDLPQALVGRGGWLVQGAADPCVTGWDLVWYLRSMLAELSSSGERNRKYRWSLDARNQYLPETREHAVGTVQIGKQRSG